MLRESCSGCSRYSSASTLSFSFTSLPPFSFPPLAIFVLFASPLSLHRFVLPRCFFPLFSCLFPFFLFFGSVASRYKKQKQCKRERERGRSGKEGEEGWFSQESSRKLHEALEAEARIQPYPRRLRRFTSLDGKSATRIRNEQGHKHGPLHRTKL